MHGLDRLLETKSRVVILYSVTHLGVCVSQRGSKRTKGDLATVHDKLRMRVVGPRVSLQHGARAAAVRSCPVGLLVATRRTHVWSVALAPAGSMYSPMAAPAAKSARAMFGGHVRTRAPQAPRPEQETKKAHRRRTCTGWGRCSHSTSLGIQDLGGMPSLLKPKYRESRHLLAWHGFRFRRRSSLRAPPYDAMYMGSPRFQRCKTRHCCVRASFPALCWKSDHCSKKQTQLHCAPPFFLGFVGSLNYPDSRVPKPDS